MLRLALTAGLMTLALAAPAAADGDPDGGLAPPGYRRGPVAYGRPPGFDEDRLRPPPAYAPVRRRHRPHAGLRRGPSWVQPVSYGEPDGTVFHAWLPRSTSLPIYNIPPPFFPEP
ncbi:hypothetical protein [Methylobacterium nonmethylotrophicum]|uniref:Uncharacterized protein n=1 Tax=Methylobacterium nonmethylotrophicum TaxID=1141884 RepID=A0A4Z0NJQ0_9HYPH|nr:hypothetical protein [Methylobacterium nonmethylotrophicum]TGD96568.1 hypothetical protein EU555_22660 [Methylobacterium nonmethylotrophicum]